MQAQVLTKYNQERTFPSATLIALSIYLVLFAAFNFLVYNHKNSFWIKQHAYNSQKKNVECVVLGDSHAYYGISPKELGCSSLNMANVSQSLQTDFSLLQRCLQDCPNLKLVIMHVSYHSLNFSILNSPTEAARDCYSNLYYGGISEANLWQKISDPKYWIPSALFGTNHCQLILRNRLKDSTAQKVDETEYVDQQGWYKQPWSMNKFDDKTGQRRVLGHHKQMKASYFARNKELLEKALLLCQEKNVPVLFVTVPASKAYRNHIDRKYWSECRNVLSSLSSKYGCRYIDHFDDESFQENDFTDVDHLRAPGAIKMSRLLKDQMNDMLALRSRQNQNQRIAAEHRRASN